MHYFQLLELTLFTVSSCLGQGKSDNWSWVRSALIKLFCPYICLDEGTDQLSCNISITRIKSLNLLAGAQVLCTKKSRVIQRIFLCWLLYVFCTYVYFWHSCWYWSIFPCQDSSVKGTRDSLRLPSSGMRNNAAVKSWSLLFLALWFSDLFDGSDQAME